ncbi:MAG: DUF5615 family PIN-like protein [Saprospiraceae bacterium]
MNGVIKFYTDEHVSKAIVKGLRLRGMDVMTCQEAGMMGATDEAHLAFAESRGRVIFTQDTDFIKLHSIGQMHAGIVYAPQGRKIGDIVNDLTLIHQVLTADDMINQIEFI